jgi:hypothetical protein
MMVVDVNNIDYHVRMIRVLTQQRVGMGMTGRLRCVIHSCVRVRGVLIHIRRMMIVYLLW